MRRAYAVAAGVASADYEHVLPLGVDELFALKFGPGQHAVLLRQHIEGEVDALQLAPRYGEVARLGRARGYDVGVVSGGQLLYVDGPAELELYALGPQHVHASVDDGLVQLEVRYAVTQQSAGILVLVEHRHGVAQQVKAVSRDKSGGAAAHHGHLHAVAFGVVYAHVVLLEGVLRYGRLVLAVGRGLMFHEV